MGTTDRGRRLMVDYTVLVEQWIEPDPWSWVYRALPHVGLTTGRVVGPAGRRG